jgi:hypothetical protein
MEIPFRFRLYRIACIANLLVMGCILLLMMWLLTNKGNHFSPGAGLLLAVAFFIINYKNDKIGLQLFTLALRGKPVPKTQRNSIRIFWIIQIVLQGINCYMLFLTVNRYLPLLRHGRFTYWLTDPVVIADILWVLFFITAVTGIIQVWPFVKFIHRRYVILNRPKKPGDQSLLDVFEQ